MLLSKYQCQQDKERRHQEERNRRDEKHWRCPFFAFYWNEVLSLPSADDCPECRGIHGGHHDSKKQQRGDGDHWPIFGSGRDKSHVCARVDDQGTIEEQADMRVPNEAPMDRSMDRHDGYRYDPEKYLDWCIRGLTCS